MERDVLISQIGVGVKWVFRGFGGLAWGLGAWGWLPGVRQGLCARPNKMKGLTSQNPGDVAPTDLLRRDFSASGVDQKWCGDFKELKTAECPVFLATVLDLCSRRMVGFAASDSYPTAELAKAAVNTAVATKGGDAKGVVFHSDKGSQGGFNRSSQHFGMEVCDGCVRGASGGGSGDAGQDAFAGAAWCGVAG